MSNADQYGVEGYGVVTPGYDQPYLKGAGFDPNVVYAFSGDPEKQEKLQEKLAEAGPSENFHVQPFAEPKDATYPQAVPSDLLPPKAIVVTDTDTVIIDKDAQSKEDIIRETVERESEAGQKALDAEKDLNTVPSTSPVTTEDQFVTGDNGEVLINDPSKHADGDSSLTSENLNETVRDLKGDQTFTGISKDDETKTVSGPADDK